MVFLGETKAPLLLLNCSAFTTVCCFNFAETRGGGEMPHRAKTDTERMK